MDTGIPPGCDGEVESPARRGFLAGLMAAAGAVFTAVIAVPLARAALFPLRVRDSEADWTDLGPAAALKPTDASHPVTAPLTVVRRDGWEEISVDQTVYVVAAAGEPRVLSAVCPHLGCTVQWHADRERFICPCHGGTYAADGARISGPPARDMDALPARVVNGQLQVKFQNYRQLLDHQELVD